MDRVMILCVVILAGVATHASAQTVDADFINAAYDYAMRMEETQRKLYCDIHDLLVENQGLRDSIEVLEKRVCDEQNHRLLQKSAHKLDIFYNRALFLLIGMVVVVLILLAGNIIRPKNKR